MCWPALKQPLPSVCMSLDASSFHNKPCSSKKTSFDECRIVGPAPDLLVDPVCCDTQAGDEAVQALKLGTFSMVRPSVLGFASVQCVHVAWDEHSMRCHHETHACQRPWHPCGKPVVGWCSGGLKSRPPPNVQCSRDRAGGTGRGLRLGLQLLQRSNHNTGIPPSDMAIT